nr:hypothetical protein [Tanacetum cinerariifolium]
PPQDSNIHQLIEECSVEVPVQQKQNMEQEVKIVEEQPAERRNLAPILSTREPENSLSMGYEHINITPENGI